MTNLVEILREAPEGINLYSTMVGECKLSCVIGDEISIEFFDGKNPDYITLDQYGRFKFDGECILFPHKFNLHSWNEWQEWLFRDELSIGKVVVDNMGGLFVLVKNDKNDNVKVADSNGEEFVIVSSELDKFRFATIEDSAEFFSKVGKNNCYWSNIDKTIIKQSPCDICKKEQPSHSCQDITELGRCRLEHEEPKELPYSDEEAKEFANKVSHEWWQIAMDKWNTLTEDEKKKYNQYIGFNDFSDHLMNILRSVLLGLKRNGKLVYEEGSLFSEPDQKPVEIELDETHVSPTPLYEPKGPYCNGHCGYCVYHTDAGCGRTIEIEYDKGGCESGVSSNKYNSACVTKNNKYIPKLKVGDKACLSDRDDNIYFEEILKVNDEEYYTKRFGWINCKAIDELHEINFKEYNKPFRVSDFKPFDKVLWRLGPADTWSIGFFDNYYICGEDEKVSYSVVGYEKDWVPQCVPYNIDTAHLHDTDEEYDGKYKTW